MGGGKSSGSSSSTPVVTQEQKDLLKAQTGFLTNTAFPAYQKTLGMATDVYGQVNPTATNVANTALDVAGRTGSTQEAAGTAGTALGMSGLASLFGPQYKEEQVQAALQPAREAIREQVGSENAMFGGAGGAGSSRYALARENTRQLGEQRLATAAAAASSGVEANRAAAANQLATLGGQQIAGANTAAAARIGYSQTPQDVLGKYASIIYGTPQGSTTPNFAGTQGTNTSGKSGGIRF
jgi:hypothetical protein